MHPLPMCFRCNLVTPIVEPRIRAVASVWPPVISRIMHLDPSRSTDHSPSLYGKKGITKAHMHRCLGLLQYEYAGCVVYSPTAQADNKCPKSVNCSTAYMLFALPGWHSYVKVLSSVLRTCTSPARLVATLVKEGGAAWPRLLALPPSGTLAD